MRRLTWAGRYVAAAIMALVLLLAGCSSSTGSQSEGSKWTIGTIATCSGSIATSTAGVCKVMEAWAKSVNAAGGINGHKVNLIVKDDASNPATSATLARELVERDHVIAIVGGLSSFTASWSSYVAAKGVPVVGGLPTQAAFMTNPDFFASGANTITQSWAGIAESAARGWHKFGLLVCAELPSCAQSVPLYDGVAKAVGSTIVSGKFSMSAADFTSQCLLLKDTNAYFAAAGSETGLRILDACRAQGVTATPVPSDGAVTNAWSRNPNANGAVGVELVQPWFNDTLPTMKAYHAAVKQYASDVPGDLIGPNTTYAWVAGKLFEAAAKAGNLGDSPKPEDVKHGLYALKNETLGGLTGPLTFTKDKPTFANCYFLYEIKNRQFTQPQGSDPVCVPLDKLQPLLNTLKR